MRRSAFFCTNDLHVRMSKERRGFDRAELNFPTQYRPARSLTALWQHGTIVDISAAGLRLATRELLELETKLEFEIHLPIRKDPYVIVGKVASEERRPGQYEYGVAFVDVISEKGEQIDELVQFLNKAPDERE